MHLFIVVLFCVIFVLSFIFSFVWRRKNRNLPPGPKCFPIVGAVFALREGRQALETLEKWVEQYGNIICFDWGFRPCVVLSDLQTIKDALVKESDAFAGRARTPFDLSQKGYGLVFSNGELFKEQRRFALSALRDLGFGKPALETNIREEIDYLCDHIRSKNGEQFDPQFLINCAVANVICALLFGKRFDHDDAQFLKLTDVFGYRFSRGGIMTLNPFLAFDWFAKLPNIRQRLDRFRSEFADLIKFSWRMIKEHRERFNPAEEPADYVDAYLKAQSENVGAYFSDENLIFSMLNLFGAGTETTASTLPNRRDQNLVVDMLIPDFTVRWGLMFLAMHPEVQQRAFNEISDKIGNDRLPSYGERQKLPYTEATIVEIQRLANMTPLSVIHTTTADVKLHGYEIPKGSLVIPFLWHVHRDPIVFPEPAKFKPERFLDSTGKLINVDKVLAFSAGKRSCLGESLARMELFLFLTAVIQRFEIHFPFNKEHPNPNECYVGVTVAPKSFSIVMKSRV